MLGRDDLVVLSPQWLCHDVLGFLLSHDFVSQHNGRYSTNELHSMFSDYDGDQVVSLLEYLELCSEMTDRGGTDVNDIEFEFPCYNLMDADDRFVDAAVEEEEQEENVTSENSGWVFGGSRVVASSVCSAQLTHVFARVQTRLRRGLARALSLSDCSLEQWRGGLRCDWNSFLQAIITLSLDGRSVDVKCRASVDVRSKTYQFCSSLVELVVGALEDCLPGVVLNQHALSPRHIAANEPFIHAYSPKDVRTSVHLSVDGIAAEEVDLCSLVAFGCCDVFNQLVSGMSLTVASGALSHDVRRRLARLLDPPDPMGRDWCLLAVWLGIGSDELAAIDCERLAASPTDRCIAVWSMRNRDSSTVSALINKLTLLGRQDAVNLLLDNVALFVHFSESPMTSRRNQLFTAGQSHSYDSDLTVSSTVSR